MKPRYGIVIPACNEEECLSAVLEELLDAIDSKQFEVVVGVNGSDDSTAEVASDAGVLVARTSRRGYGHGCIAAIDLLEKQGSALAGYLFYSADGSNDPGEINALVDALENGGHDLVLGCRTKTASNVSVMGGCHAAANRFLGFWCGLLTGRFYADLGPFRLIRRKLYDELQMRESGYGWTIEAQIGAACLGARILEIPVKERARLAGRQKVSGVGIIHSARIGTSIMAAGVRTRLRFSKSKAAA